MEANAWLSSSRALVMLNLVLRGETENITRLDRLSRMPRMSRKDAKARTLRASSRTLPLCPAAGGPRCDHLTVDLPAIVLRERVDELNPPWVLVGCHRRLRVRLKGLDERGT